MIGGISRERMEWRRTKKKLPCPICGKVGWCEVSDDGRLAHCMRTPSDKPTQFRGGGWLHELGAGEQGPGVRGRGSVEDHSALTPQQIDQINRALLDSCPLSPEHRAYLEGEGVYPAGCGTLRYSRAAKVAKELVQKFGEGVCSRHPALLKIMSPDEKRSWWTIAYAADGLLFPATSLEGLVLGIQIRKDTPKGSDDRYRWLSHDGLGGTPLSVFLKADETSFLIVTEGYKKAAVAARTWKCNAISLAGVAAYGEGELLKVVESLGKGGVALAFDQDKRHKPQVQTAERRIINLLAAAFPNLPLYVLNWGSGDGGQGSVEDHSALPKGLDDAVKAGAEFRFDPVRENGPKLVTGLSAEIVRRNFPVLERLYTLKQARQAHSKLLEQKVLHPDHSQTVVTSTTGTGKSQAADDLLGQAALNGWLKERVLLLAPTKANIEERTKPGTLLGQAVAMGWAVVQRGRRLVDLSQPYTPEPEDCANSQAFEAGAARHTAARFVCKDCPYGSDKIWEDKFPGTPRPFECDRTGYIASRKTSREAQLVIATKDAYLNNSRELEKFGVVVCDEELLPYLIESGIQISSEVLRGWRDKLAIRGIVATSWEKMFRLIETTLDRLSQEQAELKPGRLLNALPHLTQTAEEMGEDLAKLAFCCEYESAPDMDEQLRYEAFSFELPYRHNAKLILPYRAATSLLRALVNPTNPPYAVRDNPGSFYLELFEVRQHLVEILQEQTLVVLDSTLPPQLKLLFPDLAEISYKVPQHLEITQITNALYSKADLYRPATRQAIGQALANFARGSRQHLTIVPKRFEQGEEGLPLPENKQVEHWGLHRATNRFSDCDSLALVGHHLRPLDRIEAEVKAIRGLGKEGEIVPQPPVPDPQPLRNLRLYNHLNDYGQGAGLWRVAHPDPEVQTAIEHDYASHIIQAIGRLRAALRPAHLPPARVLILCNEPVAGLEIQQLTSLKRLTNPFEISNSSYIDIEESVKNEGSVPLPETALDEELIQDETVETQAMYEFWQAEVEIISGPDPWDDWRGFEAENPLLE